MQGDSRYYAYVKRVGTIGGLRVYGATGTKVEPVVKANKAVTDGGLQSEKLTATITRLNLEGGK